MAGSVTKDLIDLALTTTGNTSVGDWVAASEAISTEVYKQASSIGTDGSYEYQTGKNTLATAVYTPPTNVNMTANYTTPHIYWVMRCDVFPFCEALNTGTTNSGLMLRVTDGSGNWTQWHVTGSDFWDGSWRNFVLDLTNTADVHTSSGTLSLTDVDIITFYTDNSNSGTIRIVDNTWLDAVRYGDGLQAESATTEAFGFTDIALDDALVANYYQVQQDTGGVLFTQGGIILGDATGSATCNFVSLNETIYYRDQIVSSTHYGITGVASATATTDIDMQGLVIKTVGGTAAEIDFTDTDLTSLLITDSKFADMGTVKLQSGGDCRRNVYVGCDQITPAGADIRDSSVSGYEGTANTSAVVYDETVDPDGEFDGITFTQGTALTHAIEFGTNVPSTMTLRDCIFSGYSATQDVNNSTFHFKDTAGTITLNIVGGSGVVGYRTDGATIVVVQDPVTTSVHCGLVDGSDLSGARVLLYASDGTGDLPYLDTVTITQSAGTATVTHTAHGLVTGNYVTIRAAIPEGYNKQTTITVTGVNTYTYSVDSGLTSPATGAPTSTGVVISGTTDVNGDISDTRTFSTDQPVTGYARKSTSSPFYKSNPMSGTISSSGGLTFNLIMQPDE